MIHHTLTTNREQHYGVNSNCDKNRVLLQLGDGMEQVRVQLTADEVDQLITHLQHRRDEIRPSCQIGE